MKKGFTLVEALVAISILIIGILSGFILVTRALYNVSVIQDRLTASFLAQEGIELIRNIRDTNFIKSITYENVSWLDGLGKEKIKNGQKVCFIIEPYDGKIHLQEINCEKDIQNIQHLQYDPDNNLYNYKGEKKTPFIRRIIIEPISPDEIRVISEIWWQTKNMKFSLNVEDHLYNWFSL